MRIESLAVARWLPCRFCTFPIDLPVKRIQWPSGASMKFVCFGYVDPNKFAAMAPEARAAHIDECFDYDDRLRKLGHVLGGQALQPATTARYLHPDDGEVVITDGPFAETKEFIGGILIL